MQQVSPESLSLGDIFFDINPQVLSLPPLTFFFFIVSSSYNFLGFGVSPALVLSWSVSSADFIPPSHFIFRYWETFFSSQTLSSND
jgi:hypothetical protein